MYCITQIFFISLTLQLIDMEFLLIILTTIFAVFKYISDKRPGGPPWWVLFNCYWLKITYSAWFWACIVYCIWFLTKTISSMNAGDFGLAKTLKADDLASSVSSRVALDLQITILKFCSTTIGQRLLPWCLLLSLLWCKVCKFCHWVLEMMNLRAKEKIAVSLLLISNFIGEIENGSFFLASLFSMHFLSSFVITRLLECEANIHHFFHY